MKKRLKQHAARYSNEDYYSMFIWSWTCFGRHTAHHQELKSALAASGFAYVKGCWTSRLLDAVSVNLCPQIRHKTKIVHNSYRNSQQDVTVYQNLLFHVCIKLNMFRASHRPSSGAQNCTSSLWFCLGERLLDDEVAGRCQRPATSTSNNLSPRQNQRLLVQFWAPDDGRCDARNMLSFI